MRLTKWISRLHKAIIFESLTVVFVAALWPPGPPRLPAPPRGQVRQRHHQRVGRRPQPPSVNGVRQTCAFISRSLAAKSANDTGKICGKHAQSTFLAYYVSSKRMKMCWFSEKREQGGSMVTASGASLQVENSPWRHRIEPFPPLMSPGCFYRSDCCWHIHVAQMHPTVINSVADNCCVGIPFSLNWRWRAGRQLAVWESSRFWLPGKRRKCCVNFPRFFPTVWMYSFCSYLLIICICINVVYMKKIQVL